MREQQFHNAEMTMNFVTSLGSAANGSIEPKFEQHKKTPEVKERVANGEFLRDVDHQIICGCIDGRCGGQLRVSSAGGTISLMVMDDLTTKRFAGEDGSTRQALSNVVGPCSQLAMRLVATPMITLRTKNWLWGRR